MTVDFDVNKIVADFVQGNIDKLFALASQRAKGVRNLIKSKLATTYAEYLSRLLDRYGRGKSFFVRSEPRSLYEYFVPLDLGNSYRQLSRPDAADVFDVATRMLLIGSGGSGKTMMMRHLLISSITSCAKVPVFFELRQLNDSKTDLLTALLGTLEANGLNIDEAYFKLALAAGHFTLILDGFDELERSARKRVTAEIHQLASHYPDTWILVSSRFDSELEGWDDFAHLKVQPLTLATAVELVEKVPFDDELKKKFVSDLQGGLFRQHRSFLSNPLLLSILLLTYSDVAHIPNKLSLFFNQAYESLFQKHDALKGGFQRERQSALDIQDFSRAFAAFSILSYDQRKFSFPTLQALTYFDEAKTLCHLAYSSQAILNDAVQAVCLLVEEGMNVTFAHRSFQEYFVARFIQSAPPESKEQLIRRFAPSVQSDSVLALLHEIDAYSVERYYILPALDGLRKRMKLTRALGITHFLRYVKLAYSSFEFQEDVPDERRGELSATIRDSAALYAIGFVSQRYCTRPDSDVVRGGVSDVREAFRQLYGENVKIETRVLTSQNPFVRSLYASPGFWGADYLRRAFSAEERIRAQHQSTRDSLVKILKS